MVTAQPRRGSVPPSVIMHEHRLSPMLMVCFRYTQGVTLNGDPPHWRLLMPSAGTPLVDSAGVAPSNRLETLSRLCVSGSSCMRAPCLTLRAPICGVVSPRCPPMRRFRCTAMSMSSWWYTSARTMTPWRCYITVSCWRSSSRSTPVTSMLKQCWLTPATAQTWPRPGSWPTQPVSSCHSSRPLQQSMDSAAGSRRAATWKRRRQPSNSPRCTRYPIPEQPSGILACLALVKCTQRPACRRAIETANNPAHVVLAGGTA